MSKNLCSLLVLCLTLVTACATNGTDGPGTGPSEPDGGVTQVTPPDATHVPPPADGPPSADACASVRWMTTKQWTCDDGNGLEDLTLQSKDGICSLNMGGATGMRNMNEATITTPPPKLVMVVNQNYTMTCYQSAN